MDDDWNGPDVVTRGFFRPEKKCGEIVSLTSNFYPAFCAGKQKAGQHRRSTAKGLRIIFKK